METLFRFNVVRDVPSPATEILAIDLATSSAFQARLGAVRGVGPRRLRLLKAEASRFAETDELVSNPSQLAGFRFLREFAQRVDALTEQAASSPVSLREELDNIVRALESLLSAPSLADFLSDSSTQQNTTRVKDSILAIKLLPSLHRLPVHLLAEYLRVISLLQTMERESSFPESLLGLRQVRHQTLRLPSFLQTPQTAPPRDRPPHVDLEVRLKELSERYGSLEGSIRNLTKLQPRDFNVTPQQPLEGALSPEEFRPFSLFKSDFEIRKTRLAALFSSPDLDLTRGSGNTTTNTGNSSFSSLYSLLGRAGSDSLAADFAGLAFQPTARIALKGRPAFQPGEQTLRTLQLSPGGLKNIERSTVTTMASLGLKPSGPLMQNIKALKEAKREVAAQARKLMQPFGATSYRRRGQVLMKSTLHPVSAFLALNPSQYLDLLPGLVGLPGEVPTTHADIRPAGEMELLIVRQQLVKYVTADVSHIQNVLRGEKFETVDRVRHETEREIVTETEETTTKETSLESTDRFELARETETSLKETLGVKGSLEVSGELGPQFKYKASGEVSWQKVTEDKVKTSSKVAREVTEKASEKVTERLLRRETLRVKEETEKTVTRELDNESGTGNQSGVYQWVHKVYEAQTYNYGLKEIYDLMIPEPGALLMELFSRRRQSFVEIEEIPELTIQPSDLDEDNYQDFVSTYHATDVEPPPEPFVTVSYDFNTGGEDKDQEFTNSTRISVPPGFEAYQATVGAVVAVWDNWSVDVIIGQRSHRFSGGPWVWNTDLDLENESIPFAMVTDKVGDVAIAVEVLCAATDRAKQIWQAETYAKLVQAYRTRKSEQEAKLADLMADAPLEIQSSSELANRNIMVDEIKRSCISLLTEQHFDLFNATRNGTANLPEMAFGEAASEGEYVRFFEQAFEWENLSWITYPYFWGRKSTWENRVLIEDDDPEYEGFLKAGYARVVLPVRDGFGAALDHFRLFGEPWLGGTLPTVSDDLYLPLADEVAERLGRPGGEEKWGEPWPVVVPTRLVKLREDDSLPEWEQNASGEWVERSPA